MRRNKLISLLALMTVAACMLFTACAARTPEAQVEKDIKEYKKSTELGDAFSAYNIDADEETGKNAEAFFEKVKDFDYKIGKVQTSQDGNTATVQVRIKTYDFGTAYLEAWEALIEGNEISTDINKMYKIMFGKLGNVKDKNYSTQVTVNCSKNADDKWESDIAESVNFQNAVYGGMVEIASQISNLDEE